MHRASSGCGRLTWRAGARRHEQSALQAVRAENLCYLGICTTARRRLGRASGAGRPATLTYFATIAGRRWPETTFRTGKDAFGWDQSQSRTWQALN